MASKKSTKRLGDFGVGTVHSGQPIGAIKQPRPGGAPAKPVKPTKKGGK